MDAYDIISRINKERFYKLLSGASQEDVERVLSKDTITIGDLPILLSPAIKTYIQTLKERAKKITKRRFGNTILLYAPLYLSNECVNDCEYCGFRVRGDAKRRTLSVSEVMVEAQKLYNEGFRHILLVSGENRKVVNLEYLDTIVKSLSRMFPSVSIEVGPLKEEEYEVLCKSGLDGLTIYQETYDESVYRRFHKKGPKSDFYNRLINPELALKAGVRRVGIGALLGLNDFRFEVFAIALHLDYLMKRYWKAFYTVSFPRIRTGGIDFQIPYPVSDEDLIIAVCLLRILFEDAGLILSTREPPHLRDDLIGIGITQMSAGSRTNPGGYTLNADSKSQFEVSDERSLDEVIRVIRDKGYEPVMKDWDFSFQG